jgi:hypothetical protein
LLQIFLPAWFNPSFAVPFAEPRTAAHIDKYSGFQVSETPCHSDEPFETHRTPIHSVTSVPKYATSGRSMWILDEFPEIIVLLDAFVTSPVE